MYIKADISHYEAASLEYVIAHTLKLENLTNVNDCSRYGDMENLNKNEIDNLGNILLCSTLVKGLMNVQSVLQYKDIVIKE